MLPMDSYNKILILYTSVKNLNDVLDSNTVFLVKYNCKRPATAWLVETFVALLTPN